MMKDLLNPSVGGETYYTPPSKWAAIYQPDSESALANPPFKDIESKEYQP